MKGSSPPSRARSGPRRTSIVASFAHAIDGIIFGLRTQRNMRIHAAAALAVIAAGMIVGLDAVEWIAVTIMIALVSSLELVNTSIEAIVDLASPRRHPLAKAAKDTAAGAVLVAATASVVVAALIVFRHLD